MNIDKFNYKLPKELIAQYPPKNRGDSKLLSTNPSSKNLKDLYFKDFIKLIEPNDLIVFNNTKVIKARLFGNKETGGNLKPPSKEVGNKRRASFCARMRGMKKKLTSKKTANDPQSRINKALRAWNC